MQNLGGLLKIFFWTRVSLLTALSC